MNNRATIDRTVALALTSAGKSRAVIASLSIAWLFLGALRAQGADQLEPAYPREGAFVRADNLRVTMTVPHEEEWVAGNPRAIWVEFKYGK